MIRQTDKQLILVVDDTPDNIDVLVGILRSEYEIKAALNGEKALKIANADPKPDMILLDIMMPGVDGYEVCRRLKADPATSNIPVIFVTAKDDIANEKLGFELGAVDYITKPISPPVVEARLRTHLALYDQNRELARQVDEQTKELSYARLEIIRRLGRAGEYKDNETGLHVIRMSHYSRLIAQAYGGNDAWVERLFNAAPMHDIGKIGIPDHILLKPGKLDADEWELMKKHTEFGAEIIGDDRNSVLQTSRTIALTHHEKWDGSGYPHNLAGEVIPLEGRIVAIADVFDALTSERPYKKAWSVEDAVKVIDDTCGSHFDPSLVPLFHKVMPEILEIKERYAEETAQQ
ncbi:MAG: two-component system response regulator [Pseudomonadota bacterium]